MMSDEQFFYLLFVAENVRVHPHIFRTLFLLKTLKHKTQTDVFTSIHKIHLRIYDKNKHFQIFFLVHIK